MKGGPQQRTHLNIQSHYQVCIFLSSVCDDALCRVPSLDNCVERSTLSAYIQSEPDRRSAVHYCACNSFT